MDNVRGVTYELLRTYGMTKVFGNPGSTELPFLQGFPKDFSFVLGLHEGVVVGMADGYAQGTGRAAFVNLHTAAGLGNAMGAVTTAYYNRTPLVITAGQQDRRLLATEPFLSGRLVEMALPYVKWSHQPARGDDVPAAIDRAYHIATQAPQGPAFVSVPMDDWDVESPPHRGHQVDSRAAPAPQVLDRTARILRDCARPAMVAGAGVDRTGAWSEAVSLAEKLGAEVWAEPFGSRAGFPQDHGLFRGHLPPATASISDRLSEHDVVLVLGASVFRYFQYSPGPPTREGTQLIHITDDLHEAARAPSGTISITADVALTVSGLIERLPDVNHSEPSPPPEEASPPKAQDPLRVDYVMHVLSQSLPDGAIVVEETPSSKAFLHEYVRIAHPGGFYSTASGGLGFATAASVGLKMASPDRPVACVVGDGAYMYAPQALWSAARYSVPVVFVVINNGQYKVLKLLDNPKDSNSGIPGADLPGLNILQAARSVGCAGERIENADGLPEALSRAFEADHPYLLEVIVDPDFPRSFV